MSSYALVDAALAAQAGCAMDLLKFEQARAAGGLGEERVALSNEHARLVAAVRTQDSLAVQAFRQHDSERRQKAADLRLKASEAGSPNRVVADELLRSRLLASRERAEDLVDRAVALLRAGEPERAEFYLGIAKDKGARMTQELEMAIGDALDKDGDRKKAREFEDGLARDAADFSTRRSTILAASVGLNAEGEAGTGSSGERASAHAASTMESYFQAQAAGKPYVAPADTLVRDVQPVRTDVHAVKPGAE